jgi:hypothetical protein
MGPHGEDKLVAKGVAVALHRQHNQGYLCVVQDPATGEIKGVVHEDRYDYHPLKTGSIAERSDYPDDENER